MKKLEEAKAPDLVASNKFSYLNTESNSDNED